VTATEFRKLLEQECEVLMFNEVGDDAVVTVYTGSFYVCGTMKEALEYGYPIDGLLNVAMSAHEAVACHMSEVARLGES